MSRYTGAKMPCGNNLSATPASGIHPRLMILTAQRFQVRQAAHHRGMPSNGLLGAQALHGFPAALLLAYFINV